MHTFKRNFGLALGSFIVGAIVSRFASVYLALAVPTIVMLITASVGRRRPEALPQPVQPAQGAASQAAPPPFKTPQPLRGGTASADDGAAASAASATPAPSPLPEITDPELASAVEYIGLIQDMVLLEGEKNALDDEIVQKTLSLLSRITRLIPDLAALGDSNINYNIVRLVRRDLNSTINPFLRLSGEAKRQNRRVLLDGIRDINSKLTAYTQTIEQKDLLELRTKAELIQQRYRYND